jgi:hypothetical protein
MVSFDYVNNRLGNILSDSTFTEHHIEDYKYKYYGTAFQTIAFGLEQLFALQTSLAYFHLRHLMVFTLFCLALLAFYQLLYLRFSSVFLSLLGVGLLICSPRIFAHAFFNVKDGVFLSLYLISLCFLIKFLSERSVKWILWLSVMVGLTISTRILGIYLIPLSIFGLLVTFILHKDFKAKKAILLLLLFLVSVFTFTVAFWPILWEGAVKYFISSFSALSKYNWQGDVLLNGMFVDATDVPWDYTLQWIVATSPIIYIGLCALGISFFAYILIKEIVANKNISEFFCWDSIILLAFLGPLVAVSVFKSTLYDGWRHMHFIWPPLLYFGVFAISTIYRSFSKYIQNRNYLYLNFASVLILIIPMVVCLVKIHPYQNIYFNAFAKRPWVENYDLDYWGQGYKETYKQFVKTLGETENVTIHGANYPAWECYRVLPEHIKAKLTYTWGLENTDYYISNFRFKGELDKFINKEYPMEEPIFLSKIHGQVLYGVFKIENIKK